MEQLYSYYFTILMSLNDISLKIGCEMVYFI